MNKLYLLLLTIIGCMQENICLPNHLLQLNVQLQGLIENEDEPEKTLTFDREKIIDVEGYWAYSADPAQDDYKGKYPFPIPHKKPWLSKDDFVKKLRKIQGEALTKTIPQYLEAKRNNFEFFPRIIYVSYRGHAPSRLEPGVNTEGGGEYIDTNNNISWTVAFLPYYVEKFNVKPSREFYHYVMNYSDNPRTS